MTEISNILLAQIREIVRTELQKVQNEQNEFMCVEDCATYLNVTPQTVYKRSKVDLPFHKAGKRIYFLKKDVDKWLLDNRKMTLKELYETRNQ